MSGKGIDDADLDELLENNDHRCTGKSNKWATTTNNYTYTINSNVLIDLFRMLLKPVSKLKVMRF